MHLLVTGGAGFVGSNSVRPWVDRHPGDAAVVCDVLTDAGNLPNLADDPAEHGMDTVVHFAAESYNSPAVVDPERFFRTDVLGTREEPLLGRALVVEPSWGGSASSSSGS